MISAVLNILKPPGMTSHDAVSFVRQLYRQKRVGHCGTLDPAAAGVLPVYLGNATRLVEYADQFDKEYRAELLLGVSTDTGDDTGSVLREQRVVLPAPEKLQAAVNSFQGGYDQIPPMYSALKIGGVKLYELARAGQEVERLPRRINIPEISLVAAHENALTIQVTCSKGTYIRTLCEDIGAKLDLPATMAFLLRIRVGPFLIENSVCMEELADNPEKYLLPPETAVLDLPACQFDAREVAFLKQGRKILAPILNQGENSLATIRLYDADRLFFGIGSIEQESGLLHPIKIFAGGMDK
jgi:tRNA pseudouridine55 synthase